MLALALILSIVESYIPPIVPTLPYAKIGLTNVVLLACFLLVGVFEGYAVLLLKCLLAAVFAGNFSMLIWSVPSSLVAYTVMVLLFKTKIFSTVGLSVAGGMLHNFTQILVATIVVGTSVFFYLPYMLLAGGIAGFATGIICHFAVEGLKPKLTKSASTDDVEIADDTDDETVPDETDESNIANSTKIDDFANEIETTVEENIKNETTLNDEKE